MLTETKPTYILLPNPQMRQIIFERSCELAQLSKAYDSLIFLDKSARPLAHIWRKLFPVLFPDTPKPEVRFLNIGTEKRSLYTESFLKDTESLIKIFGLDNITELFSVLNFSRFGKRLIVDDFCRKGGTKRLSLKILSIVDKNSQHDFFEFLHYGMNNMDLFIGEGNRGPALPWQSIYTMVEDSYTEESSEFRFQTIPQKDKYYSRFLKKDLDMLIEEGLSKL